MKKKLGWLAAIALPLVTLADVVTPAWDEKVVVPVTLFDAPDWRFWSVGAVGFIIVVGLTIWIGKRKSISNITGYVVLEVMIGVSFAVVMYTCFPIIVVEERVIHHPEEYPDHGPKEIREICCECGKAYTITVYYRHYIRDFNGLCDECRRTARGHGGPACVE